MAENPRIVVALLNATAWPILESAALGQTLSLDWERDDNAEWQHLVDVGLALQPGELKPEWSQIVKLSSSAPAGFRFVSQMGPAVFDADLAITEELASLLLRRFVVDEEGNRVRAAKELELSSAPAANAWELLRRVLPPIEEFRAAPKYAAPAEVEPVAVPQSALDELASLVLNEDPGDLSSLPPALQDFLKPKALTTMLYWRQIGDGYEYALRYWVKGEKGFYTVKAGEHGPVLEEVPAGDLGYQFVWYLTGALQEVAS